MSKRNIIWLGVIVAVGVIGTVVLSLVWGLVAAGATLVISEIVERTARKRRRGARGDGTPASVKDVIATRRKPR